MKDKTKNTKTFTPLTHEDYDNAFCQNPSILEQAYTRAWQIRNFEIDKFWSRSAFFWGFIVLIFGGYITIMTSENKGKLLKMYFDIYLIVLGIIFSCSWFLAMRASKHWQENWEAHIDKLEDKITGPLYKTIKYVHSPFPLFSVSKINIFLSVVIFSTWVLILISRFIQFGKVCILIITISGVVLAFFWLVFKCRSGDNWKIDKVYLKDNKYTEFIDRSE